MLRQEINRHNVTVSASTGNHRGSLRGHEGMVTEFLAAVNVRQMHLNHRKLSRLQSIVQRYRRMRVRRRIDNDGGATRTGPLNLVHQNTLVVRLHKFNIKTMSRRPLTHHTLNIMQGRVTVHLGATLPEQVQVRAVKHKNCI